MSMGCDRRETIGALAGRGHRDGNDHRCRRARRQGPRLDFMGKPGDRRPNQLKPSECFKHRNAERVFHIQAT
jgi:hypothetical protein